MSANPQNQNKDVVYIDVDDEITSIIGKLQDSPSKVVALVLPKRAAALQSIVNLKLLKRTADEKKKNLVLITSEAALLPLAGVVGVYVAKTLQSKPAIPAAPAKMTDTVEVAEADAELEANTVDNSKPVGELAGLPDDDTIEVDNDDVPAAAAAAPAVKKLKKPKLDKKLKVPNFDSFRNKALLGVGVLILLIVGWFVAFKVMPRASIIVKTDNTTVTSNLTLTASPNAKEVDADSSIVPAEVKELKKTDSQTAPATGTKDNGTKATGSVTLSLNDCSQAQVTVPAGTTVSSGGMNFITQADVTMQSVKFGNSCKNSDFPQVSTGKTKVTAQNAGDQYNLSARSYTVSGFSKVTGSGTAMSGGTSNIIKVVQQSDIDAAKQKIIDADNASASQDISQQLTNDGYVPVTETITTTDPVVTASPNVGDEADQVSVNVTVTYKMTGAKKDALQQLLEADIKKHIDANKQSILNNGLDSAVIHAADNAKSNGEVKLTLQTNAQVGVQQDGDAIKNAVAGKKKGEVQAYVLDQPGVKDVEVKYSPFWVYRTPSSPDKITVTFEQADGTTSP